MLAEAAAWFVRIVMAAPRAKNIMPKSRSKTFTLESPALIVLMLAPFADHGPEVNKLSSYFSSSSFSGRYVSTM